MADNATQIVISARDDTAAAFKSAIGGLDAIRQSALGLPAVGAALTGVLSAGAFAAGVSNAIKFAASLDDMAERTGASVESLSALAKVAKIGGHDLSLVETGAIRLSKALAGADDEAKGAGHALEVLGLRAEDLQGLDTADALQKVAIAMGQFRDGSGKTALAMDLFGRSGAQLLPLLKDLAEAGELNGKITAEQAAMAEHFEKSMHRLSSEAGVLAKTVAMEVLPGLTRLADQMNEGIRLAGGLGAAFVTLGSINPFRSLTANLQHYREEVERLKAGDLNPLERSIAAVRGPGAVDQMIREAEKKLEFLKFQQRQEALALLDGKKGRLDSKDLPPGGLELNYKSRVPKEGAAAAFSSVNDYEMRIKEAVAGAINSSDVVKAREYADQLAYLDRLFFEAGLDAEVYASAVEKISGMTDKAAKSTDRLQELLDHTSTANLKKEREDMLLLKDALESGKISEVEFMEAAQSRLGHLSDGIREVDNFARDMGLTFSSAFEDAIVGGKNLSDVLKGLAQDIARIVIRKTVTEPVGNFIAGALKGVFGGGDTGGDALSYAKSWEGFKGLDIPTFATGTDWVPKTGLALIHQGEQIVPAALNRVGGRNGVSIVQHIAVDARSDQASILTAMRQAKESAMAEILASMSRGGQFARAVGRV